jgi:hypothetical protein
VGYAVGAELFERMIKLIELHDKTVVSELRPNSARLEVIAQQGNDILGKATDGQLGDFSE